MADVLVSETDAGRGTAKVVPTNSLGFTQRLEAGDQLGMVCAVDVVDVAKYSGGTISSMSSERSNTSESQELLLRKKKFRILYALSYQTWQNRNSCMLFCKSITVCSA